MNSPVPTMAEFLDADICYSRHGGNIDSASAFQRVREALKESHEEILRLFDAHGDLCAKEVGELMCRPLNCISGRVSELRAMNYLEPTTLRRQGSRVLRRTRKEWA